MILNGLCHLIESEMQQQNDDPLLYKHVMIPSPSDKLAMPLSPLSPSEPLQVSNTTSEEAKSETFVPPPCTTLTTNSPAEVNWTYCFRFCMDFAVKHLLERK